MCVSVGSVILVPVGCSWHEHSVVLRVRHMFKCVFFYSRWPLSTSHLLPLVFGGGGSFLFRARRKLDDDGGDRTSGSVQSLSERLSRVILNRVVP